ncbi:MAG: hypothetical protein U1E16_16295 [Hyphomicrobiales bacterium]
MKTATAILTFGFLLGVSAPALAAATPEEAQRLTTLFQSYLGNTPGVVSVSPQGDSYAAKLDLTPLFAKVKDPTVSLTLSPLEWTLTDQGGGKWKVDQSQPLDFAFGVKGQGETRGKIGTVTSTGTFDEALGGFSTSTAEFKAIVADQTMTEGGSTTRISYDIETVSMQTAMQGTPESADATSTYGFTGLKETISVPAAADGSTPAMDVVITSPTGKQDGVIKGLKLKAVSDIVTWLVANQEPQAVVAQQAVLKDKLRAALPLFTSLSGSSTLDDVTATTPFGPVAVKQFGFGAEMNGVVADGKLRETFSFTGLQIPQALVPAWAAGMIPGNFSLDVGVSDFDLAAAAALILDKIDLSKPDPLPKELDAPLMQALMPKGAVTITLGPSQILARLYDLTAAGSMTAGPVAMPAGQALVKIKGLDETMAALQAAPPDVQQMSAALLLVKGLGKAEADGSLSWKIESTPAGAITVNGADVSKMMGGQQ